MAKRKVVPLDINAAQGKYLALAQKIKKTTVMDGVLFMVSGGKVILKTLAAWVSFWSYKNEAGTQDIANGARATGEDCSVTVYPLSGQKIIPPRTGRKRQILHTSYARPSFNLPAYVEMTSRKGGKTKAYFDFGEVGVESHTFAASLYAPDETALSAVWCNHPVTPLYGRRYLVTREYVPGDRFHSSYQSLGSLGESANVSLVTFGLTDDGGLSGAVSVGPSYDMRRMNRGFALQADPPAPGGDLIYTPPVNTYRGKAFGITTVTHWEPHAGMQDIHAMVGFLLDSSGLYTADETSAVNTNGADALWTKGYVRTVSFYLLSGLFATQHIHAYTRSAYAPLYSPEVLSTHILPPVEISPSEEADYNSRYTVSWTPETQVFYTPPPYVGVGNDVVLAQTVLMSGTGDTSPLNIGFLLRAFKGGATTVSLGAVERGGYSINALEWVVADSAAAGAYAPTRTPNNLPKVGMAMGPDTNGNLQICAVVLNVFCTMGGFVTRRNTDGKFHMTSFSAERAVSIFFGDSNGLSQVHADGGSSATATVNYWVDPDDALNVIPQSYTYNGVTTPVTHYPFTEYEPYADVTYIGCGLAGAFFQVTTGGVSALTVAVNGPYVVSSSGVIQGYFSPSIVFHAGVLTADYSENPPIIRALNFDTGRITALGSTVQHVPIAVGQTKTLMSLGGAAVAVFDGNGLTPVPLPEPIPAVAGRPAAIGVTKDLVDGDTVWFTTRHTATLALSRYRLDMNTLEIKSRHVRGAWYIGPDGVHGKNEGV